MNTQKEKFGLFTTVSMITGIVIGSGIFFKTDDVLRATGGSVFLGAMLWVVAAFGIVFGGLSISQYAKKESKAGGLITYCEMAWGKTWGYISGWFQTVFYFPAITAVLSWICAIYIGMLFNINSPTDVRIWIITLGLLLFFFVFNTFATTKAGLFQNITLVVKIGSLLLLAAFGLIFGKPSNLTASSTVFVGGGLFSGLVACAFSYDGWFIAPSVAHEIKNPQRNLTRALVMSPLIILAIYLAYFIGINAVLGPELVMELQDGSVGYMVSNIMGDFGTKVVYLMVIISILGTINGVVLGYIRQPYSLSLRKEFPLHEKFSQVNKKYDIPIYSSILAFLLSSVWLGLHALSVFKVEIGFLNFSFLEIDSLPIVLTYIFYVSLYLYLILNHKQFGTAYGLVFPILAVIGSSFVIYGGFSQPQSVIYILVSIVGIGLGLVIRPKHT